VGQTDLKIVARWRYDWCANARENFQNLRKWVQSLCAPLRPFRSERSERKLLLQHFTPCIVDVHPYKSIWLPRYRVPRKTVKFVPLVPKAHGRDNVCTHRMSIKPCNFQKCFWGFLYVVVHPCSNFSLRHQMAPLRSIKFQTVDFPIFCARIIVIF